MCFYEFFNFLSFLKKIFQKWPEIRGLKKGQNALLHAFSQNGVVFDRNHIDFRNYGPKSHNT